MGNHDGRVALVTGAASGIGRATAERIAAEGGSVLAVDLDGERLAWADDVDRVAAFTGDAASEQDNLDAAAAAVDVYGRLDAVVLNAGVSHRGSLIDEPIANYQRVMDVNVTGVLLGIRATVPHLRSFGGGSIVATASTSGLRGDPGMWAYNASKAAVINLVRGAAIDLGADNIRVNAVCPGPTETGMTTGFKQLPERYDAMASRIPLQRWGLASELAAVISFLASPDASFVTGTAIPVDGGIGASTGQFSPPSRSTP